MQMAHGFAGLGFWRRRGSIDLEFYYIFIKKVFENWSQRSKVIPNWHKLHTWSSFLTFFSGEANEDLRQGADDTSLKKIP